MSGCPPEKSFLRIGPAVIWALCMVLANGIRNSGLQFFIFDEVEFICADEILLLDFGNSKKIVRKTG